MFEFLILSQFVSAIATLLVGAGLLYFIRKKTDQLVKENRPAGFWVRAICLGTDLAVIDILVSFLAFRGSLTASGQITIVLTLSYFFFSWMFFASTPAMMIARIRILSKDGGPLKFWQVLVRLGMFLVLFVGWITILFDRREKRALHDIVAQTRVAYAEKEVKENSGITKKVKFIMLGLTMILLIGLIIHGFGEKMTGYAENDQMTFFDLNKDGVPEGLTMDLDGDGSINAFKYDLDNDHVINFTTFDTDKDGVAESIDMNNDGRVDGFDFDNDNILDIEVAEGQNIILLWKVLFGFWIVGFVGLLIFAITTENNLLRRKT